MFNKELEWVRRLLESNHKSYSCWHHRRWITKKLGDKMDWINELNLCTFALNMDQRNFHCWNYRRFVLEEGHISLSDEMDYTMEKIEQNFSNYSSWHQRSYIFPIIYKDQELVSAIDSDFDLVKNAFYTQPDDQSSWFYHNWLMMMTKKINPSNYEDRVNKEIEMLKELISIEPEAKWPKVISLRLMKENGLDNQEDYISLLEQIKDIDKLHVNFYGEYF